MNNCGKNRIKVVYKQIRTKNALSPNCPASLVLHFVCKALSKPSAYNQVLFHKTCDCQFGLTHFFTTLLVHSSSCDFSRDFAFEDWFLLCFWQVAENGRSLGKSEIVKGIVGLRSLTYRHSEPLA